MQVEEPADTWAVRNARVRSLQVRIRELEIRNDGYLQRIRQLEQQIGARGIIVPVVFETSARAPDDVGDASSRQDERASARRIAELEHLLASSRQSEREKEILIAGLASIADERQDAVEEIRAALDRATVDLLAKDAVIAELHAASEERLRHLELAAAESDMLRGELRRAVVGRDARDDALDTLQTALAERLDLLVHVSAEADHLRGELERATADLHDKDRVIEELAEAAAERLQLIVRLTGEIESLRDACTKRTT
jgi:DNA repair exonuclease SbcCD ATPase subunit